MKTILENLVTNERTFLRNVLTLADCEIEILARRDNLKDCEELNQWERALAEAAIDHYVGLSGAATSALNQICREAIIKCDLVGTHGDDRDLENLVSNQMSKLMNFRRSWEELEYELDEVVFASDAPGCLMSVAEAGALLSCQPSRIYALIHLGRLMPQIRDFSIGVCNAQVLNLLGDCELLPNDLWS